MSNTTKLPLLSSLGVALTGCADPISGDWIAVKGGENTFPYTVEQCFGGYSYYDYGYEYSYSSYEDYCYSQSIDMWMTIDDELDGTLVMLMSYSYGSYDYEDSALIDLIAQNNGDGKYTLYTDEFVLDCTMSDNVTMKCDADALNNDDNPDYDLSPLTFSKSDGKSE